MLFFVTCSQSPSKRDQIKIRGLTQLYSRPVWSGQVGEEESVFSNDISVTRTLLVMVKKRFWVIKTSCEYGPVYLGAWTAPTSLHPPRSASLPGQLACSQWGRAAPCPTGTLRAPRAPPTHGTAGRSSHRGIGHLQSLATDAPQASLFHVHF